MARRVAKLLYAHFLRTWYKAKMQIAPGQVSSIRKHFKSVLNLLRLVAIAAVNGQSHTTDQTGRNTRVLRTWQCDIRTPSFDLRPMVLPRGLNAYVRVNHSFSDF